MLKLISAHLIASVTALKRVADAADLASASADFRSSTPAAYLIPLAENASANMLETAVEQRVEVLFSVILAVSNLRDTRGANAQIELGALRKSVTAALLSWQPDVDHEPIVFSSGHLIELQSSVLWWQDEFKTAYFLRS